ncbi:hypothetical protein EV426DRAFT_87575 [Tirmania nivea]|nr:hypothetical protein EV426DRAFT_87575 [Tirmania nivea]
MTLISSSRTAKAGRYSRCSRNVLLLLNALAPSLCLRCSANLLDPFSGATSLLLASGSPLPGAALSVSSSLTPITFPRAVPAILVASCACFSRSLRNLLSLTNRDPFLLNIAISLCGSRIAGTGSNCFVNTFLPSKKGGRNSWTSKCTRTSSSSSS